jgi:CRISPR-associated protein Cmr2
VVDAYLDRDKGQNWSHIYNDIAMLEARHAFKGDQIEVATAIFSIYFGEANQTLSETNWWNTYEGNDQFRYDADAGGKRLTTGILGDRKSYLKPDITNLNAPDCLDLPKIYTALNEWFINLAKVGFHLCSST